jgi:8-oxo-dGTP diphosphatase
MMTVVRVVGAAICEQGKCLVAQRGPSMSNPGKWEFPGGKVEVAESDAEALVREIGEELGLLIEVGARLAVGSAQIGGKRIDLIVYAASVVSGDLTLREHARARWLSADELPELDWAEADVPALPAVAAWLST